MAVGKCCLRPYECHRNCDHRFARYADLDRKLVGWQTPDGLLPAGLAGSPKPAYSDTKPSYYHAGPDDLIAFALKHDLGAIEFTIMRYVMRWKQKQPLLSLQKAREYLDRLIEQEETRLANAQTTVSPSDDTGARSP